MRARWNGLTRFRHPGPTTEHLQAVRQVYRKRTGGCSARGRGGLDLVERERRREAAEGVDLLLELRDLLLGLRDCVDAGDEAARRPVLVGSARRTSGPRSRGP